MTKDVSDSLTGDLVVGVPGKRGPKPTGKAKSDADRQRERRERLRAEGKRALNVHVPVDLVERVDKYVKDHGDDFTKDDIVEKALRAFFRKR